MFNIEQIEVVKGPAGADNGRTAPTGYVNLVTKMPTRRRLHRQRRLGSGDGKAAPRRTSNRCSSGRPGSALRLNVMAQDYGMPGRDEVENKRWGVAPSMAFGLDTRDTHLPELPARRPEQPARRRRVDHRPAGTTSTLARARLNSAARGRLAATTTARINDYDDVKGDMFTARIEHDLAPGMTLRNTTR